LVRIADQAGCWYVLTEANYVLPFLVITLVLLCGWLFQLGTSVPFLVRSHREVINLSGFIFRNQDAFIIGFLELLLFLGLSVCRNYYDMMSMS
jgi:hypothetical protein